jgi:hypothetical protein
MIREVMKYMIDAQLLDVFPQHRCMLFIDTKGQLVYIMKKVIIFFLVE